MGIRFALNAQKLNVNNLFGKGMQVLANPAESMGVLQASHVWTISHNSLSLKNQVNFFLRLDRCISDQIPSIQAPATTKQNLFYQAMNEKADYLKL